MVEEKSKGRSVAPVMEECNMNHNSTLGLFCEERTNIDLTLVTNSGLLVFSVLFAELS